MKCTPVRVGLFTEEEALTLFLTKAVGHDTVLTPELGEIAAKIAKECPYLPLAIVTLAGSLRGLEGTREWRNALNESISVTKDTCDVLIDYWIAEELIADMDSVEAQLDKVHAVLGKRTSSCLLESVPDIHGMMGYIRVHDLIRDMAIRITANSPRFMDLERISFMDSLISELPITPPICPQLTTLLLNCRYRSMFEVIPNSFFTNMPCLEVLDLSWSNITLLPESISNLENLHVLILDKCKELKYAISQQFQGLQKYCHIVGQRLLFKRDLGKEFCISFKSIHFGSGVDQPVLPADIKSFGLDGFHDPISLSAIPWFKDANVLRKCVVKCCNGLESIFSSSTFTEDGQISLGTVESFDLKELPKFRALFEGIAQPHSIYFNLKELSFSGCNALKNILPIQLLQNFPNLESLGVERCENVEDIIVERAETSDRSNHQDYSNSISLLKLECLTLVNLPRLNYNGVMVCPSIAEVEVYICPMVRRLPLLLHMDGEHATTPCGLIHITAQKEWWESLEWDDPVTKTLLQPYVDKYHIIM
ncbi:disease resistance protein RPS2-like [Rhododendron vialii]|uniref:disease resistance protein RPS2-like n=1 Tax=Rhododendron vialii TaxID=182163 RepID=UPI00265D6BAC|nr:disease resistance protein RPS2-like [Rhododendron vialii]